MSRSLREAMPKVTAFIDDLRAAFGADEINASIRAGLDGQPTFYAKENGQEVGTPYPIDPARVVSVAEMKLSPACASCAFMKVKLGSPDGTRREKHCTRYHRPALKPCADWREA